MCVFFVRGQRVNALKTSHYSTNHLLILYLISYVIRRNWTYQVFMAAPLGLEPRTTRLWSQISESNWLNPPFGYLTQPRALPTELQGNIKWLVSNTIRRVYRWSATIFGDFRCFHFSLDNRWRKPFIKLLSDWCPWRDLNPRLLA